MPCHALGITLRTSNLLYTWYYIILRHYNYVSLVFHTSLLYSVDSIDKIRPVSLEAGLGDVIDDVSIHSKTSLKASSRRSSRTSLPRSRDKASLHSGGTLKN